MDIGVKNQIKKCITMAENGDPDILKNSLSKLGFNRLQIVEAEKGIKSKVNVSAYCDNIYDAAQMKSIRLALEDGMDISAFCNPEYDYMQMEEIKAAIKENIELEHICNPSYDYTVMREIRKARQKEILISIFYMNIMVTR